jgi:hypothetical protein
MPHHVVLVPAPTLGPASWQPVAAELRRGGLQVTVPSLDGLAGAGPPYAARLAGLVAGQVPAGPGDTITLVMHSGAGLFAGQVSAAIAAASTAAIFADAGLPGPDGGGQVVGDDFLPYLREIATDGIVPPWPLWFPDTDLGALFPDEPTRQAVLAEAGPLPLAFFEEQLPPVPGHWPPRHAGYLLFSEGYRQEARKAAGLGWPVAELPGEHLHMLVSPAEVAAAIIALAGPPRPDQPPG